MRVLVAGASGVIGNQVVPVLTGGRARGGRAGPPTGRRPGHRGIEGIEVGAADALDRAAVAKAVAYARPDAVVHLLTAIPPRTNPRRLAADFALTNRLRTEGTRNLLDAAREAGATRIITQGLAYAYQPGEGPADEDAPLWTDGPAQFRPVVAALAEHERLTREAGGVVLRFGHLYGPGSMFARGGSFAADVAAGKVPLVGGGHAVFSFTHARDAATAVLAALDKDVTGGALAVCGWLLAGRRRPGTRRLPDHDRLPAGPGPPALGPGTPGGVLRPVAAGARADRRGGLRPTGHSGAPRVGVDGDAAAAGTAHRAGTGGLRPAGGVRPALRRDRQRQLVAIGVRDGRIQEIYAVLNPDKLAYAESAG